MSENKEYCEKTYYIDKTGTIYMLRQEWSTPVTGPMEDFWTAPIAEAHLEHWREFSINDDEQETKAHFEANIGRKLSEDHFKPDHLAHLLDSNIA
jgi:hypothetical protein